MSKIPKVTGNVMIKYLIKKGFVITHRKGSHARPSTSDLFTTILAGNCILKTGTMLTIYDIGMTRNDFVTEYDRGNVN